MCYFIMLTNFEGRKKLWLYEMVDLEEEIHVIFLACLRKSILCKKKKKCGKIKNCLSLHFMN